MKPFGHRIGPFCLLAALALSGCLVSKEPLLDARNGAARPIAAGLYEACSYYNGGGDADCKQMEISVRAGAPYEFRAEDEGGVVSARFRRLARGAWFAQMKDESDEVYYYFLAESGGDGFAMAMVVCGDIPQAVRTKYVARGELEVDDDATTCTVKTLGAAIAATKAYRAATDPGTRDRTVYRKLAEQQE